MKSPGMIRDRALSHIMRMVDALRIDVSCYHPDERAVLELLTESRMDVAEALCQCFMGLLGHEAAPANPRFDKTRRAMNRKIPKGPRGVPKSNGWERSRVNKKDEGEADAAG